MNFQEIEAAYNSLSTCPKCSSKEGFWFGMRQNRPYVQCKCCGTNYELFEMYTQAKNNKEPQRFRFFRK